MEIAGIFLWLVAISIIFTVYGKIAERFGNFRPGNFYLLLLIGAAGGLAFLFSLIIIFSIIPYDFVLNSYILIGSALAIVIRYIAALLYIRKRKTLNCFQSVTSSVIIGLGFFIVENYISIIFMKNFVFGNIMMFIPVNTFTSSVIGYYAGRGNPDSVKGGIMAVIINCIFSYFIALQPLYKGSVIYIILLSFILLSSIIYTIVIGRKAVKESV